MKRYIITAGIALGGWYGWKWYKGRQKPPMIPPVQSPSTPMSEFPNKPNTQ